jgi:hypothetical protein
VQVVTYALPAAGLAVGINSQLRQWLLTSGVADTAAAGAVGAGAGGATSSSSAAAIEAGAASIQQLAHLHLAQEAVLALLLPAAVRFALGPRVTAAAASPYWVGQTLGTCLLLFPLVDPLLSSVWQPVAEVRRWGAAAACVSAVARPSCRHGCDRCWINTWRHCCQQWLTVPLLLQLLLYPLPL